MLIPVYLDIDKNDLADISIGDKNFPVEAIARRTDGSAKIEKYYNIVPCNFEKKAVSYKSKDNKLVLSIVIGVAAAAVVGGVIYFYDRLKKKNRVKLSQHQVAFQRWLQIYLEEARKGSLKLETLNKLITIIENIQGDNNDEVVALNISVSQFDILLNKLYDYTQELPSVNSVKTEILEGLNKESENKVLDLKKYLEIQRKIIRKAA